ncbi:MAG: D-Ala-D-Ala carboxypeptidase family metallohydrolase [Bacteroidales bacterium]|nr:D-Ala-D-Ala carboxypeptidase family metallohydrolase [Bacteroidales bacterium]
MANYFTYGELTRSATADRLGIDNTPKEEYIQDNIIELMRVLDGIREGWTKKCKEECWGNAAIVVNSGYRCDAFNTAINGSKTSAHSIGSAADIEPVNGRNKEFLRFVEQYLLDNHIPFDQLINEKPVNGVPSWIHIGLKNREGKQRRMVFTIK